MLNKRKSVMLDEEQTKRNKTDDVSPSLPYLPEDLVLENIVPKLSAPDLSRFTSVSKSWYSTIVNETHYRNIRNLSFNLLNVPPTDGNDIFIRNYFFSLHKDDSDKDKDHLYDFELLSRSDSLNSTEPVGNCNGITCIKRPSSNGFEEIFFVNPVTDETLIITCLTPEIEGGGGSLEYLCHGFGFDSSSQEYKVVIIYTTKTTAGERGFICMVVTLGATSWKKIVTSTSEISPPPGFSAFPSRTVTRIRKDIDKSATICGGDLFWRVTNTRDGGEEVEMLLSFDIHNEKIQFIRLPNECNSLIKTPYVDGCLETGHHLLEYKGYPCVARSEKILITESVCPHLDPTFCCYRFKVHLYILKDKFKQIWVEEKTFDVRMKEDSAVQDPFFLYFCSNTNGSSQPTRIFSFSDQVILYWFDGGCLIFYNLQMNHHNVVRGAQSSSEQIFYIFDDKYREITPELEPGMAEDDIIEDGELHCPCIDYQLHAQVENTIALETLVPEGGEDEFDCYEKFLQSATDTGRKTAIWYGFCSTWFSPTEVLSQVIFLRSASY